MGYREACEVARIRQELRERLMSQRHEGAETVLDRLHQIIEKVSATDGAMEPELELHAEYERWKLRFELLASSSRN
jgi:hypothetical protein